MISFFKVILMFGGRKLLNYTLVNQSHSFLFFFLRSAFFPIVVLITEFDFNATNIFLCQHGVYNYERERETQEERKKKERRRKRPNIFSSFSYLTNNTSSIGICKNNMRNANTLWRRFVVALNEIFDTTRASFLLAPTR